MATSIPPNNFLTSPNPNASDTPNYPRDTLEYRRNIASPQVQRRNSNPPQGQANNATPQGQNRNQATSPQSEVKRLSLYVFEEFRKEKIRVSLMELMRVPEIRETILGSLDDATAAKTTTHNALTFPRNQMSAPQSNIA